METYDAARRLEALGNPSRLTIYRVLIRSGSQGLAVGDIQQRTKLARSTLSHHLHKLIAAGLVYQERQGTTLFCHANYDVMRQTIDFLSRECCVEEHASAPDAA